MSPDPQPDRSALPRAIMRWVLALFFAAAGVAHLYAPDALLAITPDWVPFAPQVIFITGLCELAHLAQDGLGAAANHVVRIARNRAARVFDEESLGL